jgi:hypothetical protein
MGSSLPVSGLRKLRFSFDHAGRSGLLPTNALRKGEAMPIKLTLTTEETATYLKRAGADYRKLVMELYRRALRIACNDGCKVLILAADGTTLDTVD